MSRTFVAAQAWRSPADQLVTTWEDLYERKHWQAFLDEQGYQPRQRP